MDRFELHADIAKIDESLGLVMGWAIVCTENGKPYFDVQGDHIPEQSMLEAATGFAKSARLAGEEHARTDAGTVAFIWPVTAEISKACGIETNRTGLLVGVLPDENMLQKFRDGTLTGFSIGGKRIEDEEAENA